MSRRQGGCRNSASNSPELRNGFACCLYRAVVTWKLVLGYHRVGGRAPDALEATIRPSGAIPTREFAWAEKQNLGKQKTDIRRQRARGAAAAFCPGGALLEPAIKRLHSIGPIPLGTDQPEGINPLTWTKSIGRKHDILTNPFRRGFRKQPRVSESATPPGVTPRVSFPFHRPRGRGGRGRGCFNKYIVRFLAQPDINR